MNEKHEFIDGWSLWKSKYFPSGLELYDRDQVRVQDQGHNYEGR